MANFFKNLFRSSEPESEARELTVDFKATVQAVAGHATRIWDIVGNQMSRSRDGGQSFSYVGKVILISNPTPEVGETITLTLIDRNDRPILREAVVLSIRFYESQW